MFDLLTCGIYKPGDKLTTELTPLVRQLTTELMFKPSEQFGDKK